MKKVLLLVLSIVVGIIIFWSLKTRVTENLDAYIYALPFKEGTGHRIVQGYGGIFSHKNKAALDFYMPVGTRYTRRGKE